MKYLKSFNESFNRSEIDAICEKYDIEHYNINEDGTIDMEGNVVLSQKQLHKIPLKFRNVNGYFSCCDNRLTTLKGAPIRVSRGFDCNDNQLISLNGSPQSCGYFNCSSNQLTSLKGAPKNIGGSFNCVNNKIKNIDYLPNYYKSLYINENPIFNILKLFTHPDPNTRLSITSKDDKELIMEFNEREIIQNDILILDRLVEFLEDVGKPQTKEYLYDLLKNEYEIR